MTRQQALDVIAATAAVYDVARAGRQWKTLADTTNDPIDALRRPLPWRSWIRSEDYYSEGQMIWLDADTLIRERSHDQRSLDDFARSFFGVDDGSFVIKDAKGSGAPIQLLIKTGERYRTMTVDYHDGLRYPRLERIPNTAARLDQIFTPK